VSSNSLSDGSCTASLAAFQYVDDARLTNDNDHELDTVHLLSSVDISEVSKDELSEEGSDGGRDLESEVLVGGEGSSSVVDVSLKRQWSELESTTRSLQSRSWRLTIMTLAKLML
jgi:hypothetical protein